MLREVAVEVLSSSSSVEARSVREEAAGDRGSNAGGFRMLVAGPWAWFICGAAAVMGMSMVVVVTWEMRRERRGTHYSSVARARRLSTGLWPRSRAASHYYTHSEMVTPSWLLTPAD